MTDVTVAPQGSALPAVPTEVEINQNPTTSPTPVGSQAPDKPVENRAQARRASVEAAFDRAANPDKVERRPKAPPAEAKMGHNQPPEDEKVDLRQRPQPHREQGRFARAPDGATPQAPRQSAPLPEHAPYREPPPRISERARIDWAATPETVRGDFHRMHTEFDGAYRRYRADHEAMNTIRPYHEMAAQHGTTLDRALSNYVSMEQKLRADPIGGLDLIVHNLNLIDPQTNKRLNLRDVAYHVLSQSPEQLKMMQQGNAQSAQSHQIGALHQELVGLKSHLQQMHTQQQFTYTRSAVDHFADSHPRFDELGDLIHNEIGLGFDLDTAYRRAELLRPATHAAQTRTTSAQTRPTDKSISGAPGVTPSNGASRRGDKPVGRREAVLNAIKEVRGSL